MYIGVRNYSQETLRHREIIRRIKLRHRHTIAIELPPQHKRGKHI